METKDATGMFNVGRDFGSLLAQLGRHEEAKKLLTMAVQVGRAAGFPDVQEAEEVLKGLDSPNRVQKRVQGGFLAKIKKWISK
jgi:hypothetical protein